MIPTDIMCECGEKYCVRVDDGANLDIRCAKCNKLHATLKGGWWIEEYRQDCEAVTLNIGRG